MYKIYIIIYVYKNIYKITFKPTVRTVTAWRRKGSGGDLIYVYKHVKGGYKNERDWLFSVVSRENAVGTNSNTGGCLLNIRNCFILFFTGAGCQEKFLPWRCSKAIWTWSWATCSQCPCLSRAVGPDAFSILVA